MNLSNLKYAPGSRKKVKRIGRGEGSGHGGTSTKGNKGLKSRSGVNMQAGFEGGQMPLQRRLPKFGFTSQLSLKTVEVRLQELNAIPKDVTEVDFSVLKKFGIVRKDMKRAKLIAGSGFDRAIVLRGVTASAGARAAIEAAGGKLDS